MLLFRAVIGSIFGRGAKRPFRAAIVRLLLLALTALLLGYGLAMALPPLPMISAGMNELFWSAVFVTQLSIVITLLASYGIIHAQRSDTLLRLLLTLPLCRSTRWLTIILPGLVLSLLALLLIGCPLIVLCSQSGLSLPAIIASMFLGAASGLGLIYGIPRKLWYAQFVAIPGLLAAEYTCLQIIRAHPGFRQHLTAVGLVGIIAVLCITLWASRYHLEKAIAMQKRWRSVRGASLPSALWFIKKIVRTSSMRTSLTVTFGMSCIATWLCVHADVSDPSLLSGLAALLIASFTSDIRGLTVRINPVEIAGLRGTSYFILAESTSTLLISCLAVSPLIVLIGMSSHNFSFGSVLAVSTQLLLGFYSGLFASTLVVPLRQDITAQFTATIAALAILAAPLLPFLHTLPASTFTNIELAIAAMLFIATIGIEHKRNTFIWR